MNDKSSIGVLQYSFAEAFDLFNLSCAINVIDYNSKEHFQDFINTHHEIIFINYESFTADFETLLIYAIKSFKHIHLISKTIPPHSFVSHIYKLIQEANIKFNFIVFPNYYQSLINLINEQHLGKPNFLKIIFNNNKNYATCNVNNILPLMLYGFGSELKINQRQDDCWANDLICVWQNKLFSFSNNQKANIEFLDLQSNEVCLINYINAKDNLIFHFSEKKLKCLSKINTRSPHYKVLLQKKLNDSLSTLIRCLVNEDTIYAINEYELIKLCELKAAF